VSGVEGPTEDPVGGGEEGDGEVEESVDEPGPPSGCAVQPGGARLFSATDVGRRVPAEEDTVSEVSEAELREWEEEQRAEPVELGAGGELPLFLPTLDFISSAKEE